MTVAPKHIAKMKSTTVSAIVPMAAMNLEHLRVRATSFPVLTRDTESSKFLHPELMMVRYMGLMERNCDEPFDSNTEYLIF